MGAPGKWPCMLTYHAGDENNMDEDSVASILGNLKHKGCSGWMGALGHCLCERRLLAKADFWLLMIDLSFLKSVTLRNGRKIAVS